MGYYTTLDLKADFNTDLNDSINAVREFVDWYNTLGYDEYMAKYYYTENWNKFVSDQQYFHELKEFLLDCRSKSVIAEISFYGIAEIVNLSIYCEIKNYTDTYRKLYDLLLACKPIDLRIEERGEEMKTPNIYKLKNNELVKIQSGKYDV